MSRSAELRRLLQVDVHRGVLEWVDSFANAIVRGDIDLSERLINEPLDLPRNVAELIDGRLRPGIVAWRREHRAETVQRLSAGNVRAEPFIAGAFDGSSQQPDDVANVPSVHLLKGTWFEAAGMFDDAAAAYVEAGKRFGWQGNQGHDQAVALLSRAIEIDPDLVQSYWQLAEVWTRSSFPSRP
jgi:hypothetical protein